MELKNKEWKEFPLTEIFEIIQRGKRLKKDDHIEGNIPYASSTSLNNGIDGFIGNVKGVRSFENCLTIANSGSVGSTFYQPFNVVASDHVTKLENKNFSKYTYLFLATALVHKSKSRRKSSNGLIKLGNFVTLRHTQMCHFVKSGATDYGLGSLCFQ